MCGIGLVLCQSSTTPTSNKNKTGTTPESIAQLYHQLLQRLSTALQPRGPDATRNVSGVSFPTSSSSSSSSSVDSEPTTISTANPISSISSLPPTYFCGLTASVLHMQGTNICTQPLVSPSDASILCWNGEVFGGNIPIIPQISDTEQVFHSIFQHTWIRTIESFGRSDNTHSLYTTEEKALLAEKYGTALVKALGEQLLGPYAFLYYHSWTDTLYFGRDPLGRRSLLIHTPDNLVWEGLLYDMMDYLGDNEEEEDDNAGKKSRDPTLPSSVSSTTTTNLSSPFTLSTTAKMIYHDQPYMDEERNTLIISSVAIPISSTSTTKIRHLYSEIPPFGVYQIRNDSSVKTFGNSSSSSSSLYARVYPWPLSSNCFAGISLILPPPPATNEGSKYKPVMVSSPSSLAKESGSCTSISSVSYPPFADDIVTRISLELLNRLSRAVQVRVTNLAVTAPVSSTKIPLDILTYHTNDNVSVPTALKTLASNNYTIYDLPNVASNVFSKSSSSSSLTLLRGASIAVLFSGGLDSMILAALAHVHAPVDEPIDLITVCFASHDRSSPDRLAAIAGVQELRTVYPQRHWQLILVDDTFEAAVDRSQQILDLLSPRCTHMDFNIGNALWSGSRGIGFVEVEDYTEGSSDTKDNVNVSTTTKQDIYAKSSSAIGIGKSALLRYGTKTEVSNDNKHVSLSSFNGKAAVSIESTELPFDKMMQYVSLQDIETSIRTIRSYACPSTEAVREELEYLSEVCQTVRNEYRDKVKELNEVAKTLQMVSSVHDESSTVGSDSSLHAVPSKENNIVSSNINHANGNDTKHKPPRICSGPGTHNRGCLGGSASTCPRNMCKMCCTKVYHKEFSMQSTNDTTRITVPSCKVHKNKEINGNSRPESTLASKESNDSSVRDNHNGSMDPSPNDTSTATTSTPASDRTSNNTTVNCATKLPVPSKNRILVRSSARVVLIGIGADEQLGGYGRHRSAYIAVSWPGVFDELQKDMNRIWIRNLGRDDRLISDHGRESRSPYLDEGVISFIRSLPLPLIMDPRMVHGIGDKRILRTVGRLLGLRGAACLVKRAIHFGTRIAKASNVYAFGSNARANGLGSTTDWEVALGIITDNTTRENRCTE